MNTERILYLCLTCFEVSRSEADHHGRRMVCCDVGVPGDERRKPAMDNSGRLKSHAPRWYLEAAYRAQGKLYADEVNRNEVHIL